MNELKFSDSPYLQHHANDPVDWMEWGDKAFSKAKNENKLIFLSIGYSTCHWCNVMHKESFTNEEIADILNRYYVSIKVDREELSDIDKYYQKVYQLMHKRGGGWPLSIIMTPDKKVFYSATYIPPKTTHFSVGLKELLLSIANDWINNRAKIEKIASNVEEYFKNSDVVKKEEITQDVVDRVINDALNDFDLKYGGIKGAPKFPMESMLDLLIDIYKITKNENIYKILDFTLEKIALSGLIDQVEGGVFRYSTDERWEIPHFEKMLYNNANLPYVYLRFFEISQKSIYKEVALNSIDEMLNRFFDKKYNLFYSASDADSDGVEGGYFTYEYDEVFSAFSKFENREELLDYFNIKKYGNFNGRNHIVLNSTEKPKNYDKAIEILKSLRKTKTFPFIDTKKMVSWNSMMVNTLFYASKFNNSYKDIAIKVLESIFKYFYKDKLYHSFNKDISQIKDALLEDYSFLIKALISAYEFTYDNRYLEKIKILLNEIFEYKDDFWYMNRQKSIKADFSDSAYSSSLSILANNFLDLSLIFYDMSYYEEALNIIEYAGRYINNYPLYYSTITKAYLKSQKEFIIKSSKPLFDEIFDYPYVLWVEGEDYEVCTLKSCMLKSKNLDDIKELIR